MRLYQFLKGSTKLARGSWSGCFCFELVRYPAMESQGKQSRIPSQKLVSRPGDDSQSSWRAGVRRPRLTQRRCWVGDDFCCYHGGCCMRWQASTSAGWLVR